MYGFLLGTSLSINTGTKTQKKKTMCKVTQRVRGGTGNMPRALTPQSHASGHSLYYYSFPQFFLLTFHPCTKHKKLFVLSVQESMPTSLVLQPEEFPGLRGNWDQSLRLGFICQFPLKVNLVEIGSKRSAPDYSRMLPVPCVSRPPLCPLGDTGHWHSSVVKKSP